MRVPVIIKSANAFSSIIEMKFCFNLKDILYFLSMYFFAFTRKKVGVGEKEEMAHVYVIL